ncbi:hypothetical protein MYX84_06230 [Acidobacteria bacterium AH-259-O06]|nr:hypothetical protein [Acidobacteria bacterium AH-259-O06]
MEKITRRHLIATVGTIGSGLLVFGSSGSQAGVSTPAQGLEVRQEGDFVEIENTLVKARFTRRAAGVKQQYFARGEREAWTLVLESFHPPKPRPVSAAPLFGDVDVTSDYRLLSADIFESVRILEKTTNQVRVLLSGTQGKDKIEQTVVLKPGQPFFHIEVEVVLGGTPARLEYVLSSFAFAGEEAPDFTHAPCLKRAPDNVLGDRVFHSPVAVVQKGQPFAALVPDLDLINSQVVYAKGARPIQGSRGFRVPIDPERISMPTALDLELKSGMTSSPLLSYGFIDFITEQHVFWRHENQKGAFVRELSSNRLRYGFDLLIGATAPEYRGYQTVSRYLWKRYGAQYFAKPRPQAMPFTEYARVCYPASFAYQGDMPQDTKRYSQSLPYNPEDSGPLQTWLEFELNGRPVGGLRATPSQWYYDIQFMAWWNGVRDALGMYFWGKQSDPSLVDKARRIVNLALEAPQDQGIFPAVFRFSEKRWMGCYWKFPDNYDPHWNFPQSWQPEAIPRTWDFNSDYYHVAAASKTGANLLRYLQLCEEEPRILPYLRRYGDLLVEHIDGKGSVPVWFTSDLRPVKELAFNAEGGIHIWFLSELYAATGHSKYLGGAKRIAQFLVENVLPEQRWYDFETFYSCGRKPENFRDQYTGQWPRCTLSMIWAIDGFASLYQQTRKSAYLDIAQAVADYAAFYQSVWQPHFIVTAYAFGGFTSQNSDAEWLDMRQSGFAEALVRLGQLTSRQDYLERGIAALRASFALINHPRHIENNIFSTPNYPLGLSAENIDHEGLPQLPLRSGPDWGEVGALAAAATITQALGGAYIDTAKRVAVGVDGLYLKEYQISGKKIHVKIENQLRSLPVPYTKPYSVELRIFGLPPGNYQLIINNEKQRSVTDKELKRLQVEIKP